MYNIVYQYKILLISIVILLSIKNNVSAQLYNYEQLKFKQYTTADNLASNGCSRMYTDSYGFLWVSNYYGVSIFNGQKFSNLPLHDTQTNYYLGDYPHSFLQLNRDSMLISSNNGFYIFNYNNYQVNKPTQQPTLRSGAYVRIIGFDAIKKNILARVDNYIVVLNNNLQEVKKIILEDENQKINIVNKHTYPFHYYYTNSGYLLSVNITTFKTDTVLLEADNRGFITINKQLENETIVFTSKSIYRLASSNNRLIERKQIPANEYFKNGVRNADMDAQQNLWVAGSKGLFIYHTASGDLIKASVLTTNHGHNNMSEATYNDIVQNNNGFFITSINGGVLAYDVQATLFNNLPLPGAVSNSAFSMIVKDNNLLGVTDLGGLVSIPVLHPQNYQLKKLSEEYNNIMSIETIDDNYAWIICYQNLKLAIINTNDFTVLKNNFPTDGISKLFYEKEFSKERSDINLMPIIKKAGDDIYYYSINNKLYSIVGNINAGFNFSILDSVSGNTFISAIGVQNEKIVIGTGNFTLYSLEGQKLQQKFTPPSPIRLPVKSINIAKNNDIYILSTNGLYIFDSNYNHVKHFKQENSGIQSNILYAGHIDKREVLWMSSAAGIIAFDITKQRIYNYSSVNLFDNRDFNSRSITVDKVGNIFFGGTSGITSVLAQQAHLSKLDGRLYFAEIRNDNQIIHKGVMPGSLIAGEKFTYNQNSFHFSISCILYNPPGDIQYAYQLQGWDKEWIIGGNNSEISYTNLPPGKYALKVKELNTGDMANEITYSFYIKKPFWKTGWFITLAVFASAGLVTFFIMFYLQKKLEKQRINTSRQLALKAERERISKELHDDLGSGLTSIKLLSKSILAKPEQKNLPNKLDNIGKISSELIDQMSEIIWLMNHSEDTLQGMLAYLRLYMAEYLQRIESPMKLKFENEILDEDFSLNGIQKRNLLLIIKETFHNAVKHSQAHTYSINCNVDKTFIYIDIIDDGIGLPSYISNAGNGLGNIRKRINDLKGTIEFSSNMGTQINIKIIKEKI